MNEKIIFLLRSVAECLEICVADELEEEKTKKYLNKKTTNRYATYASLVNLPQMEKMWHRFSSNSERELNCSPR